jgi:hypothetical protein
LEARDLKGLEDFQLKYTGQYRDLLAAQMREAYEFAKKGAADELKVASPPTKRDTTTLINQYAQAVADKQMSDLLFIVKSEVLKELRKNTLSTELGITDILAAVAVAFQSFFDSKVILTGAIVVAQGVNRGRNDVFETSRNDIAVYQYSALLDARTCPICADLDGSVVDYATYRSTKWEPPIHAYCRCIWVAVKNDQVEIPETTGFPKAPGGITDPSL